MHEQVLDLAGKSPHSNPRLVSHLMDFFNYALPAGGIISIPFIGYLLDHYSFVISFLVLCSSGFIFGIMGYVCDFYL